MNKLDKLNELVEQIHEIEDGYGYLHRIINNTELTTFTRQAKLCDEYGLRMSDFYISGYNNSIELRSSTHFNFKIVKCPKTWCTNKTTNYKFIEDEEYIILSNGNVGRYSFGNFELEDWSLTNDLWDKFVDKVIGYSPVEHDSLNCTWIFTMSDGIRLWNDFDSIYIETRKEFEKVLNEAKIKKLQEQINKLKNE